MDIWLRKEGYLFIEVPLFSFLPELVQSSLPLCKPILINTTATPTTAPISITIHSPTLLVHYVSTLHINPTSKRSSATSILSIAPMVTP